MDLQQDGLRMSTTPVDVNNKIIKTAKVGKQVVPFETEEMRLKQKCFELKKRIVSIESQNEMKAIAIARSQRAFQRLQFEYSLLLESLERRVQGLPIADLKVLQAADINGGNIEALTIDDIKQLLNSTYDFKEFDDLKFFNKNKLNGSIDASTATTTRKRPANSASAQQQPATKKKVRDPREPKRPTNAYLFFCDAEREKIKSEWISAHPNEHIELTKVMTEAWKSLSDEDKKPYYEMYEKDKVRYHKAIEEYAIIKEKEQKIQQSDANVEEPAAAQTHIASSLHSSPAPSSQIEVDSPSEIGIDTETATPRPPQKESDSELPQSHVYPQL